MGAVSNKKLKPIMSADEVSKVLRLKKKDLKEFEREGLFDYVDKAKRKIDQKNFERLKAAVALKRDLGVNPAGIDVILHMRDKMTKMQKEFNGFLMDVRRKLGVRLIHNLKKIESDEND